MKAKILLLSIILFSLIIRIYQLGNNPPSLYWDEVSLGYNAFSILDSGKDEHGENLPLARFIAFGDFKPPGYIYASTLPIKIFGLTEAAVRIPSMISGVLMVVMTYLLVLELFNKRKVALLACLFIAISPWSIHFSRTAFEANLAAFFNLGGVYFFVRSQKTKWFLPISVIFFILAFYTFNANRIISPLLITGLLVIYYKSQIKNVKYILISFIIGIVLILPSVPHLLDRESRVRFQEVSIFNNLTIVELANERQDVDNSTWWSRLLHNRRILFTQDFLKHYSDNFNLRFLFTHGDANPRLSLPDMGQLFVWDLPFFISGILFLLLRKHKAIVLLVLWAIIVHIPAGTAKESPHALRIISILPVYQIFIAYGLYSLINKIKYKYPHLSPQQYPFFIHHSLLIILSFLLAANMYYYLHNYFVHYPKDWSGAWQYGYKETVSYLKGKENDYDNIYFTPALGRPYIYFAFYNRISTENLLSQRVASRDWFGFWTVKKLGNINFEIPDNFPLNSKLLLVTTSPNLPNGFKHLTTIHDNKNNDVFWISERI